MFKKSSHQHTVLVIIPTTNKELNLAEICILSVFVSTYKAQTYIINEGKERSEQRNIGLEKADYDEFDYVLYLDSDQYVHPGLIEECVELMKCGYSAIYIPEKITTSGWFGRLRDFEREFYTGTAIDCIRFFRRQKGLRFNVELKGPEDADFDRRIKGLRATTKNCLYHNDGIGFKDYFRKKAYYGKSMKRYAELNPNDKCLDIGYRCFGVFVENGKWKKILRHPIKFMGIILLLAIRGIIYVRR